MLPQSGRCGRQSGAMSSDASAASRLQRWVRKRINGLRSSAPPTPSSPRPSPPTKAPPSRPWQRLAQRAAAPMGASTPAANTEVPVSAPGSSTPQSQATGRVRSNGRQAATPLQAREQPTQRTATSATTSNFGGNADADAATDEHDSAPAGGTSSVFSVARMAQRMLGRRSGARAWASEAKKVRVRAMQSIVAGASTATVALTQPSTTPSAMRVPPFLPRRQKRSMVWGFYSASRQT